MAKKELSAEEIKHAEEMEIFNRILGTRTIVNLENYIDSNGSNGMNANVEIHIDVSGTNEEMIIRGFKDYIRRCYQNKYTRKMSDAEIKRINDEKIPQHFEVLDLMSRGRKKEEKWENMSKEDRAKKVVSHNPDADEIAQMRAALDAAEKTLN
ncbi:hypothetical protein HN911_13465 [Candidatus Bathyarchaeota archaeon]|jgi:hypothetical protein|nr:hypothetical protein [Candidatus Bathyarchaeota archaeon]